MPPFIDELVTRTITEDRFRAATRARLIREMTVDRCRRIPGLVPAGTALVAAGSRLQRFAAPCAAREVDVLTPASALARPIAKGA